MRSRCLFLAALAAAAGTPLALAANATHQAQQAVPSVSTLVDAAASYVANYQEQLTSVVADETYTQHVVAQMPRDGLRPLKMSLASEIFFMFTAGHDWMAIRDVRTVNGLALEDGPDLRLALQELPAPHVAGRFKSYNSRFNVGRVTRNFNEPTLSLLPLDARHRDRFAFARARVRQAASGRLVTLTFKERRGPTLIRNLDGGNAFAVGEVTVDSDTGRVTRAMLAVTIDSVRATLSTDYAFDERLGIMVPVRFGEHYEDGVAPRPGVNTRLQARYEDILCEAVYSNFRRFEVLTKIR